jgi:glycosyltransferase involved in cell wall biosynthesis
VEGPAVEAPFISILLLSYNHESYIQQCLSSLFSQSCSDFEVVYLDNCSTDSSSLIASAALNRSGVRYKLAGDGKRAGIAENLNRCLRRADGNFVVPLSCDDWLEPTYVERMKEYCTENPQCSAVIPDGDYYFNETGNTEPLQSPLPEGRPRIFDYRKDWRPGQSAPLTVGWCVSRRVIDELGGWDESLLVEDMDMFFRVSRRLPIHRLPERLIKYRRFAAQLSRNYDFMARGTIEFYEKHSKTEGWTRNTLDAVYAELYRRYAAGSVDHLDLPSARKYLWKALRYRVFSLSILRTIIYYFRTMLLHYLGHSKAIEPPMNAGE